MKRIIYLTLLLLSYTYMYSTIYYNSTRLESYKVGDGNETIQPRSLFSPVYLSYQNNSIIEVYFNLKLSNINIKIKDSYGNMYYSKHINSNETEHLNIDVSTLPAGSYTIQFKFKNKNYSEIFEIE